MARALAAAEKQGLVHRDLKPSNIMLVADEEMTFRRDSGKAGAWVKVIDFGLAKIADKEGESISARPILGTPAFSSPEQREGRAVDIRSDIYSLGATLCYALTGKPFRRHAGHASLPVAQLTALEVPASFHRTPALDAGAEPEGSPALRRRTDPGAGGLSTISRGRRSSPPANPALGDGCRPGTGGGAGGAGLSISRRPRPTWMASRLPSCRFGIWVTIRLTPFSPKACRTTSFRA